MFVVTDMYMINDVYFLYYQLFLYQKMQNVTFHMRTKCEARAHATRDAFHPSH